MITPNQKPDIIKNRPQRAIDWSDEVTGATKKPVPAYYRQSWAVVIGVNDYRDQHPRLSNARNDAEAVAALFKEMYNFEQVFTMYDQEATRDTILELLRDKLPAQVEADDRVVIFFAGHGTTREGSQGHQRGYLIPHDAQQGKYSDYVDMTELHDACEWIPAKHIFIVLDCCFSGVAAVTARAAPPLPPPLLNDVYLKRITEQKAWQVLTAGALDEMVADSGARPGHSAFTSALLAGLEGQADENNDALITATELANYVKPEVTRDTFASGAKGQTPFFNYLAGSDQGDFVFIKPGQIPKIVPANPIEREVKPLLQQYPWLWAVGAVVLLIILIAIGAIGSAAIHQAQLEATITALYQAQGGAAARAANAEAIVTAVANAAEPTRRAAQNELATRQVQATATIGAAATTLVALEVTQPPTYTPTVIQTDTPTITPTATPWPTVTNTPTPTPTATPTPSPMSTTTPTPKPQVTPFALLVAVSTPFWMDRTEVTNAQYQKCMEAKICSTPEAGYGSIFKQDNYPVVGVNWSQAQTYCQWWGGTLPSQIQWQQAASPNGRKYPWGEVDLTCDRQCCQPTDWAVVRICGQPYQPQVVGSKLAGANPDGILDLIGNVWEWTTTAGTGRNNLYVVLGGSWNNPDDTDHGLWQNFNPSDPNLILAQDQYHHSDNQGFRCVYNQEPQ